MGGFCRRQKDPPPLARRARLACAVAFAAACYPCDMASNADTLLTRITQTPGLCGGRACVRGMRIRVSDVLDLLAAGVGEDEILADFPDLERDDIRACLVFAARRASHVQVAA